MNAFVMRPVLLAALSVVLVTLWTPATALGMSHSAEGAFAPSVAIAFQEAADTTAAADTLAPPPAPDTTR